MDRVRVELLTPLIIAERQRAARRMALANEAALPPPPSAVIAARLGRLLVNVGRCRETLECRRASTVPLTAMGHAGGQGR